VPFQPTGPWLHGCNPKPGFEKVSILMLAATADRFVAYAPGGAPEYPSGRYPGMEQTRDAWLAALGIQGPAEVDQLPDLVQGDSYEPHSGVTSSHIERYRYPAGPAGQELWFYKAIGSGHAWPSPTQLWNGLWQRFGKANQDIDFADHAWEFFQRHKLSPEGNTRRN
jgi:poly(3-hydroxybutyrate) depolymerase